MLPWPALAQQCRAQLSLAHPMLAHSSAVQLIPAQLVLMRPLLVLAQPGSA